MGEENQTTLQIITWSNSAMRLVYAGWCSPLIVLDKRCSWWCTFLSAFIHQWIFHKCLPQFLFFQLNKKVWSFSLNKEKLWEPAGNRKAFNIWEAWQSYKTVTSQSCRFSRLRFSTLNWMSLQDRDWKWGFFWLGKLGKKIFYDNYCIYLLFWFFYNFPFTPGSMINVKRKLEMHPVNCFKVRPN